MMMSLNCPTSPVYRTSAEQKKQGREAAQKRRGTPKALRDLLREKCRIRMQESRQNAYQQTRKLLDVINEQTAIDEILREEVADLEKDVELQEQIFKELRAEANYWFADQIEQEEKYLIEVGETDLLCCPVCQKNSLDFMVFLNSYKCVCGVSFLYTGNTNALRDALEQKVSEHEQQCSQKLLFYTEPFQYAKLNLNGEKGAEYILSAMCDYCDFFTSF